MKQDRRSILGTNEKSQANAEAADYRGDDSECVDCCSGAVAWKKGPALRYRDPASGAVVLVDAQSGVIFHVGTVRFRYDD